MHSLIRTWSELHSFETIHRGQAMMMQPFIVGNHIVWATISWALPWMIRE